MDDLQYNGGKKNIEMDDLGVPIFQETSTTSNEQHATCNKQAQQSLLRLG